MRTRDELIPYLTEIIEDFDNEDEFLILLSQQIVNLKKFIGKLSRVDILLAPLEFMATIDEPEVRESAV